MPSKHGCLIEMSAAMIATATICGLCSTADLLVGPSIANNISQAERKQLVAALQEDIGIKYAESKFNEEDYEAWHGMIPNIPFSLDKYPVENLRLLKALNSAKKFFPQMFWERREWKGKSIEVIPMIFLDIQEQRPYLYRANGENDRFAMNLNPTKASPLIKLFSENIKNDLKTNEEYMMSKQVLSAYIHMLIARNPEKGQMLINHFRNLGLKNGEVGVYDVIDVISCFLTDPKVKLNEKTAEVVNGFLDEVTDSPENTYHKYMNKLRLESKVPNIKIAEEYFGWKK